jgi:hypothetical protein
MAVIQWQNHNRFRAYPFVEDANRVGVSGLDTLELPNDTLLDFFVLSYADTLGPVTLTSVEIEGSGADATFTFDYNGTPVAIIVSAAITAPFQGEVLTLGPLGETAILLRPVFGEGVATITGVVANHGKTFVFDNLPIEPSLVALQDRHRVVAVSGTAAPATKLQGEVLVADGFNFRSTLSPANGTWLLNAIIGEGAGIPCEVTLPAAEDCDEFVFHLNGLHPDNLGRMRFEGGGGIQVEPDVANNKIILRTLVDPNRPGCRDPGEGA